MKTKKVQLKNIITEVPDQAIQITDIKQLKEGDYILLIWDNPKFHFNCEANNRLFGQIIRLDFEKNTIVYGGHFGEAKQYNATSCTAGHSSINDKGKFPHVCFKIREGIVQRYGNYNPPRLKGNPGFDLTM